LGSLHWWNPKSQKGKDRTQGYPKMDNMVVMVNPVIISNHRAFTESAAETSAAESQLVSVSNQSQARSKGSSELEMTGASACRGITDLFYVLAAQANCSAWHATVLTNGSLRGRSVEAPPGKGRNPKA
jgi:hypothetical protein